MEPNRFLANAQRGNQAPLMNFLSLLTTWGFFMVLGAIPLALPMVYKVAQEPDLAEKMRTGGNVLKMLGLPMLVVVVLLFSQFVIGMAGIWISETKVLRRKFLGIFTGYRSFRWKRMLVGFGLWMGMMVAYQLMMYMRDPWSMTLTVNWGQWLVFLPIAFILVPIQSAFEEVAIRGQLMQLASRRSQVSTVFPLFITSFIFAALHGANNEVSENGATIMMLHYFTFGLVLGALALMDEGLELSIGIHASNNIFSLCFVSYPTASFETPTLFSQQATDPLADYMVMLGFMALLFLILYGNKRQAFRALLYNVRISPKEPYETTDEPKIP